MPIIIDDANYRNFLNPIMDGKRKGTGLEARNYKFQPSGCLACAPSFADEMLVPPSEYQDRLNEQIADKSSLWDLREANYDVLQSLDQDGYGYCWAFSTTKACMYLRVLAMEPGLRLSGWMVASIIKNYRDEGGWGSESLDFIRANGIATLDEWPQEQVTPKFDTPAMRTQAAKRKVTEWWDGSEDRARNKAIMISTFLTGGVPVLDFNWWSHSVCGCRLVNINPLTIDIDNSWGPTAGDKGIYRLVGDKAIPDGIVVPRVSMP